METSHRILIADDQPDVLAALHLLLKGERFATQAVDSPARVLQAIENENFDLLLIDLNYTRDTTSGREGLDLLDRLQAEPNPPAVIVMTAWGSLELAVEAMRRGAKDFVLKPWDNERLIETIRSQLAKARGVNGERRHKDLEIARQVQAKLFPQRMPALRSLDYAGRCVQAGLVGGDYYDFLELGSHRVGLVLADISGKGIAAALLMSNLQAALRSITAQAGSNLALLMRLLNLQFLESTESNNYATLFFAAYDDTTRRLQYVNCGHNYPFLVRADGRQDLLESTAPVIGLLEDFQPEVRETTLGAGDLLVMYSDGVTEAHLDGGEEFGEERLAAWLASHPAIAPTALIDALGEKLLPPSGEPQYDDFTLVAARGRE
jgi:phosphoserine phosphatase RsbU/P